MADTFDQSPQLNQLVEKLRASGIGAELMREEGNDYLKFRYQQHGAGRAHVQWQPWSQQDESGQPLYKEGGFWIMNGAPLTSMELQSGAQLNSEDMAIGAIKYAVEGTRPGDESNSALEFSRRLSSTLQPYRTVGDFGNMSRVVQSSIANTTYFANDMPDKVSSKAFIEGAYKRAELQGYWPGGVADYEQPVGKVMPMMRLAPVMNDARDAGFAIDEKGNVVFGAQAEKLIKRFKSGAARPVRTGPSDFENRVSSDYSGTPEGMGKSIVSMMLVGNPNSEYGFLGAGRAVGSSDMLKQQVWMPPTITRRVLAPGAFAAGADMSSRTNEYSPGKSAVLGTFGGETLRDASTGYSGTRVLGRYLTIGYGEKVVKELTGMLGSQNETTIRLGFGDPYNQEESSTSAVHDAREWVFNTLNAQREQNGQEPLDFRPGAEPNISAHAVVQRGVVAQAFKNPLAKVTLAWDPKTSRALSKQGIDMALNAGDDFYGDNPFARRSVVDALVMGDNKYYKKGAMSQLSDVRDMAINTWKGTADLGSDERYQAVWGAITPKLTELREANNGNLALPFMLPTNMVLTPEYYGRQGMSLAEFNLLDKYPTIQNALLTQSGQRNRKSTLFGSLFNMASQKNDIAGRWQPLSIAGNTQREQLQALGKGMQSVYGIGPDQMFRIGKNVSLPSVNALMEMESPDTVQHVLDAMQSNDVTYATQMGQNFVNSLPDIIGSDEGIKRLMSIDMPGFFSRFTSFNTNNSKFGYNDIVIGPEGLNRLMDSSPGSRQDWLKLMSSGKAIASIFRNPDTGRSGVMGRFRYDSKMQGSLPQVHPLLALAMMGDLDADPLQINALSHPDGNGGMYYPGGRATLMKAFKGQTPVPELALQRMAAVSGDAPLQQHTAWMQGAYKQMTGQDLTLDAESVLMGVQGKNSQGQSFYLPGFNPQGQNVITKAIGALYPDEVGRYGDQAIYGGTYSPEEEMAQATSRTMSMQDAVKQMFNFRASKQDMGYYNVVSGISGAVQTNEPWLSSALAGRNQTLNSFMTNGDASDVQQAMTGIFEPYTKVIDLKTLNAGLKEYYNSFNMSRGEQLAGGSGARPIGDSISSLVSGWTAGAFSYGMPAESIAAAVAPNEAVAQSLLQGIDKARSSGGNILDVVNAAFNANPSDLRQGPLGLGLQASMALNYEMNRDDWAQQNNPSDAQLAQQDKWLQDVKQNNPLYNQIAQVRRRVTMSGGAQGMNLLAQSIMAGAVSGRVADQFSQQGLDPSLKPQYSADDLANMENAQRGVLRGPEEEGLQHYAGNAMERANLARALVNGPMSLRASSYGNILAGGEYATSTKVSTLMDNLATRTGLGSGLLTQDSLAMQTGRNAERNMGGLMEPGGKTASENAADQEGLLAKEKKLGARVPPSGANSHFKIRVSGNVFSMSPDYMNVWEDASGKVHQRYGDFKTGNTMQSIKSHIDGPGGEWGSYRYQVGEAYRVGMPAAFRKTLPNGDVNQDYESNWNALNELGKANPQIGGFIDMMHKAEGQDYEPAEASMILGHSNTENTSEMMTLDQNSSWDTLTGHVQQARAVMSRDTVPLLRDSQTLFNNMQQQTVMSTNDKGETVSQQLIRAPGPSGKDSYWQYNRPGVAGPRAMADFLGQLIPDAQQAALGGMVGGSTGNSPGNMDQLIGMFTQFMQSRDSYDQQMLKAINGRGNWQGGAQSMDFIKPKEFAAQLNNLIKPSGPGGRMEFNPTKPGWESEVINEFGHKPARGAQINFLNRVGRLLTGKTKSQTGLGDMSQRLKAMMRGLINSPEYESGDEDVKKAVTYLGRMADEVNNGLNGVSTPNFGPAVEDEHPSVRGFRASLKSVQDVTSKLQDSLYGAGNTSLPSGAALGTPDKDDVVRATSQMANLKRFKEQVGNTPFASRMSDELDEADSSTALLQGTLMQDVRESLGKDDYDVLMSQRGSTLQNGTAADRSAAIKSAAATARAASRGAKPTPAPVTLPTDKRQPFEMAKREHGIYQITDTRTGEIYKDNFTVKSKARARVRELNETARKMSGISATDDVGLPELTAGAEKSLAEGADKLPGMVERGEIDSVQDIAVAQYELEGRLAGQVSQAKRVGGRNLSDAQKGEIQKAEEVLGKMRTNRRSTGALGIAAGQLGFSSTSKLLRGDFSNDISKEVGEIAEKGQINFGQNSAFGDVIQGFNKALKESTSLLKEHHDVTRQNIEAAKSEVQVRNQYRESVENTYTAQGKLGLYQNALAKSEMKEYVSPQLAEGSSASGLLSGDKAMLRETAKANLMNKQGMSEEKAENVLAQEEGNAYANAQGRVEKASNPNRGLNRLMSGYFAFQTMRALRYTFSPVSEAAGQNLQENEAINSQLAQTGMGVSVSSMPGYNYKKNVQDWSSGFGSQSAMMLEGLGALTGGLGTVSRGGIGAGLSVGMPAAGAGVITTLGVSQLGEAIGGAAGTALGTAALPLGLAAAGTVAAIGGISYVRGASIDQNAALRGNLQGNTNRPGLNALGLGGTIYNLATSDVSADIGNLFGDFRRRYLPESQWLDSDKYIAKYGAESKQRMGTDPYAYAMEHSDTPLAAWDVVNSGVVEGTYANKLKQKYNLSDTGIQSINAMVLGSGVSTQNANQYAERLAKYTNIGVDVSSIQNMADAYAQLIGNTKYGAGANLVATTDYTAAKWQQLTTNAQLLSPADTAYNNYTTFGKGKVDYSQDLSRLTQLTTTDIDGVKAREERSRASAFGKAGGWSTIYSMSSQGADEDSVYEEMYREANLPADEREQTIAKGNLGRGQYSTLRSLARMAKAGKLSIASTLEQLAKTSETGSITDSDLLEGLSQSTSSQNSLKQILMSAGGKSETQATQMAASVAPVTMGGFSTQQQLAIQGMSSVANLSAQTKYNAGSGLMSALYSNPAAMNSQAVQTVMGMMGSPNAMTATIMAQRGVGGYSQANFQPAYDLSTGQNLFQMSMWGMNGYSMPTSGQISDYVANASSLMSGAFAKGTTMLSGVSGWSSLSTKQQQSITNALSGDTFGGIGGETGAGLYMTQRQNEINLRLQGASQALSAQSATLSHEYAVGGGTFGSWAGSQQLSRSQAEMDYASKFGGTVNTPWGTYNAGAGSISWSRQQLALDMENQQAGYSQQQTRLGWQLQDVNTSQSQYNTQTGWQRQDMATNRQRSLVQRSWQAQDFQTQGQELSLSRRYSAEDYAYSKEVNQLQYGWQMEDYSDSIKRATGYQRKQLVKQRDRTTEMHNLESGHEDTLRERQKESEKRQEEAFKKQVQHWQQQTKWEDQDYAKQKERFEEEVQWKTQAFETQKSRIQQEMGWNEESAGRSQKSFEIRKEQLDAEESSEQVQHAMTMDRLTAEEKLEQERYKLSQIRIGMTKDEETELNTLQQAIAKMRVDEQKRTAELEKQEIRFYNAMIDAMNTLIPGLNASHIDGSFLDGVGTGEDASKDYDKTQKASGGKVKAGSWALINDAGPEMVRTNASGGLDVLPSRYIKPSASDFSSQQTSVEVKAPIEIGGTNVGSVLLNVIVPAMKSSKQRSLFGS